MYREKSFEETLIQKNLNFKVEVSGQSADSSV
jgi:hypothetical protein